MAGGAAHFGPWTVSTASTSPRLRRSDSRLVLEPASPSRRKVRGLGHFGDAEQPSIKAPRRWFSARRHGQLHVMERNDRHGTSGPRCPRGRQSKWGPALLPAPTVAAAGTLAFQRLSSPRPSAVPCPSVPVLSNDLPPVRFAVRSHLQAGASLSAQPSVLRRPQFLTTWAWQSLAPVPHSARCRASCRCVRVSFPVPWATLPPVWPCGLAFGRYLPPGEKGPSARSGVLPLASASAGCCFRSCDHRPCRISLASGRLSGLRSRSFRFALHPFQSAPQHAGTGFKTYFPVRPDWEISAFQSVPCGAFLRVRFPLDKTDAAPRP